MRSYLELLLDLTKKSCLLLTSDTSLEYNRHNSSTYSM